MSRKTLNQVFVKGDDGVVAYIAAHSPRAANLAERYASVLPERPNISHELRWKLYIYCAPNIYHLNTALHIARHLIGFNGVIRVDANLSDDSTEDTNASPRLLFSLQDLADLLEEIESDWKLKKDYSRSWASSDFDQSWLQNHIDELENGDSFMAERTLERYIRLAADDQRVAGIVILGTAPTAMNMLTKIPNLQPVVMRESRHYWLKPHSSGNGWSVTPLGWL